MNFKIYRSELLLALTKVNKAVSSNSPLPVLSGIKFDVTNDSLILTGSDSNITIQTSIEAKEDVLEIYEKGSVVLGSRLISEIVRKMESDFITLEIIDGALTKIKGNDSTFNLNGYKPMEYPKIELKEVGEHFKINSDILKTIISQTIFATSKVEIRPIFTGVNFVAKDNLLSATATDSYRLAKKTIELNQDIKFNITIPYKSLSDITSIIEKVEDIDVYVSDRKVLFISNQLKIQTRLIDGTYPDVNRLIPETYLYELNIETKDLLSAIDRASLLASDGNSIIKLTMSEQTVLITSNSQEMGSVKEILNACEFKGEPLGISFNSRYVSDAIKSIGSSSVTIYFNGDMNPFIIKDKKDESIIQLVLPVKTYN